MGIRDSSHFIYLQIFQICFWTERLILSASKYSRYIFRGRNTQFSIGTKQKKGQVECLWEFQIFYQGIIAQIFGKKIFVFLKVRFHHEGGLSQSCYFELFFSTRYEAPPQKNQLWLSPLLGFPNVWLNIFKFCFLNICWNFLGTKSGS